MAAFTRGKACITEEDALTLCRWAEVQKFGAFVLFLVLEGRVAVTVKDGAVMLGALVLHL